MTWLRGAHRNRAFRRDLDLVSAALVGLRLYARGFGGSASEWTLFDIVILEKGNAGGGVLRASE